jgi:hypothetical protein
MCRHSFDGFWITEANWIAICITRHKKTGFFKQFAQTRYEVCETTAFYAESLGGFSVSDTYGEFLSRCASVTNVNATSRENVRATYEVTV